MAEIRQLTLTDLKQIYQDYMKDDFPLMELRPWFSIGRAWERDEYSAYGYYDGESFLAYAAFYSCREDPYILMDYLAVVPDLRGQGLGSSFLKDLLPAITDVDGIFIEAESADPENNEEDKSVRQKRINFYQANGAVMTGVGCKLFGVDYQILYLPLETKRMGEEEFFEAVCRLYRELYRPFYGKLCRPYQTDVFQT